ncbi:MAG TPA: exonuclease SbcCD subunit D C-terminal domain-containing protein, partial [Spirochaetota bacterium]|nr:exonuclease SbcCD subunit D C-terminal domain-containing protein [Spirochaetota bacterium]
DYYSALHDAAFKKKNELQSSAPVIVMGHLFAAGGKTVEGDGVRDLYVGTLEHVPASVFKSDIDYLALGHLHSPQKVGGKDYMRYCGSPLPMSFGETGIQKKVIEVCWDGNSRTVKEIDVPCFQRLERIEGDIDTIKKVIKQFKNQKQSIWLEIEYTGDDVISSLSEQIIEMTKDSLLEVLLLKNRKRYDAVLKQSVYTESLDDFNELQVFTKFLDINRIEDGQRPDLIKTYKKVLQLIHEDDKD